MVGQGLENILGSGSLRASVRASAPSWRFFLLVVTGVLAHGDPQAEPTAPDTSYSHLSTWLARGEHLLK